MAKKGLTKLNFDLSLGFDHARDDILCCFTLISISFDQDPVDDVGTVLVLDNTNMVSFEEMHSDGVFGELVEAVVLFDDHMWGVFFGPQKDDGGFELLNVLGVEVEDDFKTVVAVDGDGSDEFVGVFPLDGRSIDGVLDPFVVGLDLAEFVHQRLGDVVVGGDDVDGVAEQVVLELEVVLEADGHGQDGVEEVGSTVEAEDSSFVTWGEQF